MEALKACSQALDIFIWLDVIKYYICVLDSVQMDMHITLHSCIKPNAYFLDIMHQPWNINVPRCNCFKVFLIDAVCQSTCTLKYVLPFEFHHCIALIGNMNFRRMRIMIDLEGSKCNYESWCDINSNPKMLFNIPYLLEKDK